MFSYTDMPGIPAKNENRVALHSPSLSIAANTGHLHQTRRGGWRPQISGDSPKII